jgi:HSP20 family molecular chaperone IbpA
MTREIQKRESRTDPWNDVDRAFDEMRDRLLDVWDLRPFGRPFAFVETGDPRFFRAARTDVTDTGNSYKIVAEIPGIPKEKLDIRVRGTNVEIRGETSSSKEEKESQYVHRERSYAGYYRTLELPEPVVATEAKAKAENGLLELELPKQHPTPSSAEVKIAVQ